jgi:hypothetical protein
MKKAVGSERARTMLDLYTLGERRSNADGGRTKAPGRDLRTRDTEPDASRSSEPDASGSGLSLAHRFDSQKSEFQFTSAEFDGHT